MNVETAAVVLFSVLYLATLPACFHWPMYWMTIVRILVLLAVLTMNETAVVPFTLLFLVTLRLKHSSIGRLSVGWSIASYPR